VTTVHTPAPPPGYAVCPIPHCQWCGTTDRLRKHLSDAHNLRNDQAFAAATTGLMMGMAAQLRQAVGGAESDTREQQLQRDAEAWLSDAGYWRATASNTIRHTREPGCRGFFAHWPGKTVKGAPFMPDLLIWSVGRPRTPLWIELKARDAYQPGQREAIEAGLWRECRSVADVEKAVREWEGGER
jgi:hypothetical protein